METITKNIMIETITFNKYFHISDTSFQLLETAYGDDNRPSISSYPVSYTHLKHKPIQSVYRPKINATGGRFDYT